MLQDELEPLLLQALPAATRKTMPWTSALPNIPADLCSCRKYEWIPARPFPAGRRHVDLPNHV